jgi:hypothetical protein
VIHLLPPQVAAAVHLRGSLHASSATRRSSSHRRWAGTRTRTRRTAGTLPAGNSYAATLELNALAARAALRPGAASTTPLVAGGPHCTGTLTVGARAGEAYSSAAAALCLELERWAGGHAHAPAVVDVGADHDRGAALVDGDVLNWTRSTHLAPRTGDGGHLRRQGQPGAQSRAEVLA